MNNKIMIGLVVFLFLLTCGLGGYSFVEFGKVNSNAKALKQETTTQINTVQTSLEADLSTFKDATDAQFNAVKSDVTSLDTDLNTFKSNTDAQFGMVQGDIKAVQGDVTSLNTGLTTLKTDTAAQFAESTMDVRKVYGDAVSSVCQITDGNNRLGSGFVFSKDGYIITAWHVISETDNVVVILNDGTLSDASIVGSDKYSDIAVLKLKDNLNLKPLELANSDNVVRGEPVIVIGTPFELSDTVTYGVVSRNKGMIQFPDGNWWVSNLIQYDAATNPGNSGGPVIDAEGQVIGIAAYTITPQSGSGIAWSISSNKINRVANAIINQGSFHDAVLPGNWEMADLTPEAAQERGLKTGFGALFVSAEGVGNVEANDIVVAVDGIPVNEAADLFNYIGENKSPGDTITLTLVIRGGIKIEVPIVLIEGWISQG